MQLINENIPEATVISVGHRPELEAFHERKLMLKHEVEGARLIRDEYLTFIPGPHAHLVRKFKDWRQRRRGREAAPRAAMAPRIGARKRSKRSESRDLSGDRRARGHQGRVRQEGRPLVAEEIGTRGRVANLLNLSFAAAFATGPKHMAEPISSLPQRQGNPVAWSNFDLRTDRRRCDRGALFWPRGFGTYSTRGSAEFRARTARARSPGLVCASLYRRSRRHVACGGDRPWVGCAYGHAGQSACKRVAAL